MRFTAPVTYTTTGWIEIQAESIEDARKEAERLNDEGVEYLSIQDADCHSEVHVDEIEEEAIR